MDRLREMELFVRVVETGSFSAAARDFKLGQADLWVIYPSGRLTSTKAPTFVKWFEKLVAPPKSN